MRYSASGVLERESVDICWDSAAQLTFQFIAYYPEFCKIKDNSIKPEWDGLNFQFGKPHFNTKCEMEQSSNTIAIIFK